MFGNNMLANVQYGSEKVLNIGYDLQIQDEVFVFQPGSGVEGDVGSSI